VGIQDRKLQLERLSRDDWVLGGLGALLVFDLLVLPWFSFGATINVGSATVSIGGSLTGADAPDAWLGVLSVIATAFLVADLGFERLSPHTQLASIGGDRTLTRFALACTAAVLLGLKFVLHLGRFGELGLGFWLAIMVVAALVVLTRRARRAGPVDAAVTAEPSSAVEPAGVTAEASPGPTS
jgi:hypothetical protein